MIRKLISSLIFIPVGIVLIALSVANRKNVTVSFDPFSSESPAYALTVPLYMLILGAVICGIILGGVAVWMKQGRHRRAARENRFEAARWRSTAEKERERAETLAAPAASSATRLPAPNSKKAA